MEHPGDVSNGVLADISIRLARIETGQEHLTSVTEDITQRVSRMDDKLHAVIFGDADKPGMVTRLDRLERQMESQERRMQPWRQALVILGAGLLGGFISWVTVEALHIEQRVYLEEHKHTAPP